MAVVASGVAVLAWFGLYKFIYKQSLSPGLPGEGIFKYVAWKDPVTQLGRRTGQTCSRHRASENKWSSKVRAGTTDYSQSHSAAFSPFSF